MARDEGQTKSYVWDTDDHLGEGATADVYMGREKVSVSQLQHLYLWTGRGGAHYLPCPKYSCCISPYLGIVYKVQPDIRKHRL